MFSAYISGQVVRCDMEGDFIAAMEIRGHRLAGIKSESSRPELRGMPKFEGVCGPMWDGEQGIRYECKQTYAELSR